MIDKIDTLRSSLLARLRARSDWDIIIIGGGATGLGAAVDAASRGYATLLLEASDFAKGTSSRSTKLVHGGVRYLAQGRVALVREALVERQRLTDNASALVEPQRFVVPCYSAWERMFYGSGMLAYDVLSGAQSLGRAAPLSARATQRAIPNVRADGLSGGVAYFDARFNDAGLAVALARTALGAGALVLNYMAVTGLLQKNGRIAAVDALDVETGEAFTLSAKVVVNATGVFADRIRQMEDASVKPIVRPSQGIHLVVDGVFLGGADALLVPKTLDGRVLFAIPWQGKTLLGTTDTPVDRASEEPRPLAAEIDYVLDTAGRYLAKKPERADVRAMFAGLRPLIDDPEAGENTAGLSREHLIQVSPAGLVTIAGGKWTTYRHMAEDLVDQVAEWGGLPTVSCDTAHTRLAVARPAMGTPIAPELCLDRSELERLVREEFVRSVEDVLARRTRLLFTDAPAAIAAAPALARGLAEVLGRDAAWAKAQVTQFQRIAAAYCLAPSAEASSAPALA